jgi:hypothetical protein
VKASSDFCFQILDLTSEGVGPDAGVRAALVKLNASPTATKYRTWRSSIMVHFRFAIITGILQFWPIWLERSKSGFTPQPQALALKTNARVKKKPLLRKADP